MPRKRTSEVKASPAAGQPERPPSGRPNGARKSPARSSSIVDGAGAMPKSASPAARKGTTGAKKTSQARPAPYRANSPKAPPDNDGFREAVTRLAYHFWEARASQDGSPDEDWRRAEIAVREVLAKMSASAASLAGAEIPAGNARRERTSKIGFGFLSGRRA